MAANFDSLRDITHTDQQTHNDMPSIERKEEEGARGKQARERQTERKRRRRRARPVYDDRRGNAAKPNLKQGHPGRSTGVLALLRRLFGVSESRDTPLGSTSCCRESARGGGDRRVESIHI